MSLIKISTVEDSKCKRDWAVAHAEQGFMVFRLQEKAKEPIKGVSWKRTATNDVEKVRALWTDRKTGDALKYNIGIMTGLQPSGRYLMVVDLDVKNGKNGIEEFKKLSRQNNADIEPTLMSRTASGGLHLFYFTDKPIQCSTSKIGEGIDIKCVGGYVVAPGSKIEEGEYYFEDFFSF